MVVAEDVATHPAREGYWQNTAGRQVDWSTQKRASGVKSTVTAKHQRRSAGQSSPASRQPVNQTVIRRWCGQPVCVRGSAKSPTNEWSNSGFADQREQLVKRICGEPCVAERWRSGGEESQAVLKPCPQLAKESNATEERDSLRPANRNAVKKHCLRSSRHEAAGCKCTAQPRYTEVGRAAVAALSQEVEATGRGVPAKPPVRRESAWSPVPGARLIILCRCVFPGVTGRPTNRSLRK